MRFPGMEQIRIKGLPDFDQPLYEIRAGGKVFLVDAITGPLWCVQFDDWHQTTFYIHPDSGERPLAPVFQLPPPPHAAHESGLIAVRVLWIMHKWLGLVVGLQLMLSGGRARAGRPPGRARGLARPLNLSRPVCGSRGAAAGG